MWRAVVPIAVVFIIVVGVIAFGVISTRRTNRVDVNRRLYQAENLIEQLRQDALDTLGAGPDLHAQIVLDEIRQYEREKNGKELR